MVVYSWNKIMVTYDDLQRGKKFLYYFDSVVPGEEFAVVYAEVMVADIMDFGKTLHPKVRLKNIMLNRLRRKDEGLKEGKDIFVPVSQLFKTEKEILETLTEKHFRLMVKGSFEDK